MSNFLKKIQNYFDGNKPKPEVETEIIQAETQEPTLTPFEKKLNFMMQLWKFLKTIMNYQIF